MRDEKTGKRVAAIAGRILGATKTIGGLCVYDGDSWTVIRAKDIAALAGSALTQAPSRKRRARRK